MTKTEVLREFAMRWFERLLGAMSAVAGAILVTPAELLLLYLHRQPAKFGLSVWQVDLIGLVLMLGGLGLIAHSFRRGRR
jgi:hypothetical protein